MNVSQPPNVVFGRRGSKIQPATGAPSVPLPGSAGRGVVALAGTVGLTCLLALVCGAIVWLAVGIGRTNAESARATERVIAIVNQPVTHLRRSGPVEIFAPGWFHPGATKPDFDTVDIRTTQQFPYSGYGHVSSDLNPTEMFIGGELEFNAMTKYFYTDRSLPKHRLSDAEMIEINGLYRVIGAAGRTAWQRILEIAGLTVLGFGVGFALFRITGSAFGDTA